jgi:Tfp pilus assembly protein PilE
MQTYRAQSVAKRVRPRGFTRVELLAVLATFTVGVSLIVPGIQAAREAARRNQCKSNLRQLGILIRESGGHRDDELPRVQAMNLCAKDAADSEIALVLATVFAAVATAGASFAALLIRFAVQYINRRNDQQIHEGCEEQPTWSLLERWFCPRSSSPL